MQASGHPAESVYGFARAREDSRSPAAAVRPNPTVPRPLPMPRSVSDEELVLKKRARRRLIGAIALVTLVIVLLPMFLDSDPRPLNQEISIQIPEQSTQFSSRVAALPGLPPRRPNPARTKAAESPRAESVETRKAGPERERKAVEAEKRVRRSRSAAPRPKSEPRTNAPRRRNPHRKSKPNRAPKSETEIRGQAGIET